jgi:hypothetical protein
LDPNAWPNSRNGRKIHRSNTFKLSILQENKWEVGQTFKTTLLTPSNIPLPRYGEFYLLLSRPPENHKQYEVMISDYLVYNCVDFASMMVLSLGKQGPWVPYKHLYYILQYAMYSRLNNHSSTIHLGAGMKFIDYYIEPKS